MRTKLASVCIALGTCVPVPEAVAAPPSACDALVGAWEYIPPSLPGRAIISKQASGKYLVVWIGTAPAKASTPAGGWEGTCEGSKVRWRVLYSTDPSSVGKEHLADWQATGDTMQFWFVNAEGERGDAGAVRRLK
jgi:hypothetical protein